MSTRRLFVVAVVGALTLWMNACSSARSNLDFKLTNVTGASLKYAYLSPSDAGVWGENILAGSDLKGGNTVNIRFNPNETAVMWDLRIEGEGGAYAEWKNLKLSDISEIKLKFETSPRPMAVAELE